MRPRRDGAFPVENRLAVRPSAGEEEAGAGSGNLRLLRSLAPSSPTPPHSRDSQQMDARRAVGRAGERRRLERDLHDGVQSEVVALIVKLAAARQDPDTPPALADTLAELEARAQAAFDSVRNIARGIYPAILADFGVREALRAQASRASIPLTLVGIAPRSTDEAEEAVYFACSEAIQNIAKHAGSGAQATLRLHHHDDESLVVQIADTGRGFDPNHTRQHAGLQNIRDRLHDLGGTFKLASKPGRGTVLALSLPWPPTGERSR